MKEIRAILKLYHSLGKNAERCAIAQVVRVEGSSYRREGARMLVFESGIFEGGISGGCLEGDALKRSQMAIIKDKPSVVTYDTSKENEIGVGLGCNGVIDVLISPISEKTNTLDLLGRCIASRKLHVLATITGITTKDLETSLGQTFYFDTVTNTLENWPYDDLEEELFNDIASVLELKRSRTFSYQLPEGELTVFVELVPPQFHLAIFGDNYDVYPMIELAAVLDWEVSLTGNLNKLKKAKLQTVAQLYSKHDDPWPHFDERTAIVLMAHDFKTDTKNLVKALETPAPYIACLGPKKRFVKMENTLKHTGTPLTKTQQARIYAPSGLEIGANTPEEIATSIIAEILSAFSNKEGGMLREKEGPIHEHG